MRADEDTSDHIVTFPFRLSYYEAIMAIPESKRMAVFDAICRYAFFGEKSELKGIAKAVYIALKPNIACSRKWVVSGSKGGRPRKKKAPFTENKNPPFGESETPLSSSENPPFGESETPLSSSENPPFAKPERGVTDSPKPNRTGTGTGNRNKDIPVRTTVVCPSGAGQADGRPDGVDSYNEIFDGRTNAVDLALSICGDANPRMAASGYIRQLKRIGEEAFRSELAAFWGEMQAGEVPRNPGAAFSARLKALPAFDPAEAEAARAAVSVLAGEVTA